MSTGIDANGRSFRWINGDKAECRHAVVGVPLDDNTGHIWCNPGAADPATTPKGISLELAWEALDYIRPDSQDKSVPILPASTAAEYIADAVSQILPETDLASGLVLTIPNLLSEDGQFQLLEAFKQRRFYNIRLLWRPVALALAWAGENGINALPTALKDKSVLFYDFESVNLEVTSLKWRVVKRDGDFACPVRGYPSERHWREDFRSHTTARELAAAVVGQASADSLMLGMYAGDFQRNIETGMSDEAVLYQDQNDPRRWKRLPNIPPLDDLNLQAWEQEINDNAKSNPNDMIIVHGWPARGMQFQAKNIVVMAADAVVSGADIFSERLANKQPTYFDTLPEYRIWAEYKTDNNGKGFDWFTVVKQGTVEADHEWVASDKSTPAIRGILAGMSIAQHKNELRLFVQNKTRYDDEKKNRPNENIEEARKLIQPLTATTREPIGVSIEIKAKPASGHAVATLSITDEQNKAILAEGRPAEFSWKAAEKEPEHKGYLEAQEVVGRIMDPVKSEVAQSYGITDFKELARLLVRHLTSKLTENDLDRFQVAVNVYRPDNFNVRTGNHLKLLEHILRPWGYNYGQPTRGLFGSRRESDHEAEMIAQDLGDILLNMFSQTQSDWWRFPNYMFVYAPDSFKERVKHQIRTGPITNRNMIYAIGRTVDSCSDYEDYARVEQKWATRFIDKSRQYVNVYWWSFFRCLCYHQETANIEPRYVVEYLDRIVRFLNARDLMPSHNLTPKQRMWYMDVINDENKYAAHAILFALRLRERDESFLTNGNPMYETLSTLLSDGALNNVDYPPSMLPGMKHLVDENDNFSQYVNRFLTKTETLKDREIGAGLAAS